MILRRLIKTLVVMLDFRDVCWIYRLSRLITIMVRGRRTIKGLIWEYVIRNALGVSRASNAVAAAGDD